MATGPKLQRPARQACQAESHSGLLGRPERHDPRPQQERGDATRDACGRAHLALAWGLHRRQGKQRDGIHPTF
jgi:hypothetical protein